MRYFRFFMFFVLVLLCCATISMAQTAKKTYRDLTGQDFVTKDGVSLTVSYYPGNKGKETVPVILLHDENGNRRSLHSLANYLQANGCSVIVPDLRGYGDSNHDMKGKEVKPVPISPKSIEVLVAMDIEQCKRYLTTQNDDEKLNLQKLCVIGVGEMGCSLALAYTAYDWSWGASGKRVKAVGLISPSRNVNGVVTQRMITKDMGANLNTMILFGEDDTDAAKNAKMIYKLFEKGRPSDAKQEAADRTLFVIGLPTTLQSAKLLDNPGLPVEKRLAKFIELRLQSKEIFWKPIRNK